MRAPLVTHQNTHAAAERVFDALCSAKFVGLYHQANPKKAERFRQQTTARIQRELRRAFQKGISAGSDRKGARP